MEKSSTTFFLLKYTAAILKKLGADIYIADIRTLELPLFSYKSLNNLKSKAFNELVKNISDADGFIFISPEYHGAVSSAFKNVIDYLETLSKNDPPYLSLKPVGCIAVGGAENAGSAALNSMINIVHNLRGVAAPSGFAIGLGQKPVAVNGKITNEKIINRLKRLASEVYLLAVKLKY